ncbi:unnamed protein product [Boreogadus saida]
MGIAPETAGSTTTSQARAEGGKKKKDGARHTQTMMVNAGARQAGRRDRPRAQNSNTHHPRPRGRHHLRRPTGCFTVKIDPCSDGDHNATNTETENDNRWDTCQALPGARDRAEPCRDAQARWETQH